MTGKKLPARAATAGWPPAEARRAAADASQPAPFSDGQTVVVPDSTINLQAGKEHNLMVLRELT